MLYLARRSALPFTTYIFFVNKIIFPKGEAKKTMRAK